MRSEQVHLTLHHGSSRFEICRLVAEGVRMTHRPGTRLNESIGEVMDIMANGPHARKNSASLILADRLSAAVLSKNRTPISAYMVKPHEIE